MSRRPPHTLRHLVLVLGDELDADAAAFDGFDPAQDAVWMAEVVEESTHILSSQMRTAFFLIAMRHFYPAVHGFRADAQGRKQLRMERASNFDRRRRCGRESERAQGA